MSDEDRSSVTVRIAGEEHTIRANAEPEYTRRCAELVDERIHGIQERSGLLDSRRATILAALSLTDELLQAREALEAEREERASRLLDLARRLEDAARAPEADG